MDPYCPQPVQLPLSACFSILPSGRLASDNLLYRQAFCVRLRRLEREEGNAAAGIVESLECLVIRNCTNEYKLICSMAEGGILCIVRLDGNAC